MPWFDVVALWIGRALMAFAGIVAALAIIGLGIEGWWGAIGKQHRLAVLYWIRDRSRIQARKKEKAS